jgi:hypothetical protein
MARPARSVVADRIRIEDEVWDEAFASRVRSRPPRTRQQVTPVSAEPVRRVRPDLPPRPHLSPLDLPPSPEPSAPVVRLHPLAEEASTPPRRTIRIQGRGAERHLPVPSSRQRRRPAHESAYFRPDKLAMWAVVLGLLLVLAAILSAHS